MTDNKERYLGEFNNYRKYWSWEVELMHLMNWCEWMSKQGQREMAKGKKL